ncbi:hypothetical protein HETIRDRAFT_118492 [Heterobasidion irregulare TC 32-1]|uniref:Uncharacterized protein n=1 Tax=Heterobasidion irregulare (strain TC 32-1) TaxID=747525 RepID=W4JW52_HETIT|nr:uncharacterized protein HETIRDRAFT_118492 [Heterobasidion irregulare TC 32-1]ETW77300.1 hypothetical protein HETIRDRAFT_118492 [Heterobasidion irregulare TC 32-1]
MERRGGDKEDEVSVKYDPRTQHDWWGVPMFKDRLSEGAGTATGPTTNTAQHQEPNEDSGSGNREPTRIHLRRHRDCIAAQETSSHRASVALGPSQTLSHEFRAGHPLSDPGVGAQTTRRPWDTSRTSLEAFAHAWSPTVQLGQPRQQLEGVGRCTVRVPSINHRHPSTDEASTAQTLAIDALTADIRGKGSDSPAREARTVSTALCTAEGDSPEMLSTRRMHARARSPAGSVTCGRTVGLHLAFLTHRRVVSPTWALAREIQGEKQRGAHIQKRRAPNRTARKAVVRRGPTHSTIVSVADLATQKTEGRRRKTEDRRHGPRWPRECGVGARGRASTNWLAKREEVLRAAVTGDDREGRPAARGASRSPGRSCARGGARHDTTRRDTAWDDMARRGTARNTANKPPAFPRARAPTTKRNETKRTRRSASCGRLWRISVE